MVAINCNYLYFEKLYIFITFAIVILYGPVTCEIFQPT